MRKYAILLLAVCVRAAFSQSAGNVVDEVIWVVGDDPILLSEVQEAKLDAERNGNKIELCQIPEQIAIQKLFLHQADLDSIEVGEAEVISSVNEIVGNALQAYGSKENLEAITHKSMAQFREMLKRSQRNQYRVQQEQMKLTENVKVTPAEVRDHFKNVSEDSLPMIPTQVEVQIITSQPQPSREEIERVEERLRDFSRRINDGETEFSTLARFYSEDGSARNGGELDYAGRGQWVPEFANVAFSLNDPKKVSKIVRTEFGFHIIQLIDKRGDKIKVRHILLKPEIPDSMYDKASARLDSIASDIRAGKFTFEVGAAQLSDDTDTRNNGGLLSNSSKGLPTSRFEMKDLNQDIAKVVDGMKVGEISKAFIMTNEKGHKVCAVVKLKNRIDSHRASMTEDFQVLREVVYEKRCEEQLEKWIKEKIRNTYVRIKPEWRNCNFKYEGWIK